MRARRSLVSVIATAALTLGLITAVAAPANAALPAGPTSLGVTGARPGATELTFAISDRVQVGVDVGTGNLRVSTSAFSLTGVGGPVEISRTYNSLASNVGHEWTADANRWTFSVGGVGDLSAGTSGSVIYTDGSGATWRYTAVAGTPGAYTAPAGATADLSAAGGNFVLTDRLTRQVSTFDDVGQLISIADRNGNSTSIGYFLPGIPNQFASSAGASTSRNATGSYNSATGTMTVAQTAGRDVEWIKADGQKESLTEMVDAMGRSTLFGYNGQLLTSITGPSGAIMQFGYEAGTTRVVSVSQSNTTAGSPGTSVTRLAYPSTTQTLVARPNTNQSTAVATVPRVTYTIASSSRLVTGVTDEMGRQRAATYTANGDVATATSGTGTTAGTTTATYGANSGRSLTSLASPGGARSSAAYANTAAATQYLPSSTTDSAGNSSTYTYNGAGNALTASNAMAATATLTYNANGTVATALAPGNGSNKTIYGYTNGQLTSVTPVTGSTLGARALTYDAFGRVRTATDGRGITVTYTYDKLDRLLTTAFSDGTPTVTNTYTHTGLPSTRVDGNGTTTYGYDELGRLIARVNTFAGGTITYGYDRSSNLTTVTDTRGTTVNSFDNSGVPTNIVYVHNAGTQTLMFASDNQGRRTDTWLQSNADHTWWTAHTHQDYDTSGRVSRSIGETRAGGDGAITVMFDTTYCFNAGSAAPTCSTAPLTDRSKLQWQRNNITGQVTAYTYDGAGRLLKATQTGGTAPRTYTYTYDARGNRLTATVTGGSSSSQSLSYNAANQVTTAGYVFDGTGNLTADPSGTYTYNGAEQMTQVANGNGDGSHTYKYAGTSQVEVLQQQSSGSTYQLVYGRTNQVGQPVIEQVKEDGTTAYIENDPVTGEPIMLRTSSGIQTLYVYDGLGSPTAMLTDFASVAYAHTYDPYGVAVLTAGGTGNGALQNPFLFKGGTQDRATGWVHYGNRWYNPIIGRWTQQDTLDAPLDPVNANRYAYAGCDPINNSDPTGMLTASCFWQAMLIFGTVAGVIFMTVSNPWSLFYTVPTAGAIIAREPQTGRYFVC